MRGLLVGVAMVVGGCALPPPEPGTFLINVKAGPTCAVMPDPPDPACADRDVGDATIRVVRADGTGVVVAQGVTPSNGRIRLRVPPGVYLITGGEVEGLFAPQPIELEASSGRTTETLIHYDTGIRGVDDGDGHP